jgi:hypothetical protein
MLMHGVQPLPVSTSMQKGGGPVTTKQRASVPAALWRITDADHNKILEQRSAATMGGIASSN